MAEYRHFRVRVTSVISVGVPKDRLVGQAVTKETLLAQLYDLCDWCSDGRKSLYVEMLHRASEEIMHSAIGSVVSREVDRRSEEVARFRFKGGAVGDRAQSIIAERNALGVLGSYAHETYSSDEHHIEFEVEED